MTINNVLDSDRVTWVGRQINKGGKEDPFKDIFLSSLYTLSGKSKSNILDETAKLKNELNAFYKNPKVPRYVKLLSKFGLSSLKDTIKTIDAIIDQRLTIRDAEGKQILFPSTKDLERVEKERIKKRNERLKKNKNERREPKKKTKRQKQQALINLRMISLDRLKEKLIETHLFLTLMSQHPDVITT